MALRPLAEEMDLHGKVAVITGGSKGIGKGIALRLAEAGASVLITGRDRENLKEAVADIEALCGTAAYIQADAGVASEGTRVADMAVDTFGRLDILVNNAAAVTAASSLDMTEEEWDQVLHVDLRGVFFYSQAAARKMVAAATGGSIINIISTEAFEVTTMMAHYSAAKSGVVMVTKAMAKELAEHAIRVNALAPGATLTEGVQERIRSVGARVPTDGDPLAKLKGMIPLGRMGTPDDMAKAVLFLASNLSSYVTGTVMVVDGGRLLGPNLKALLHNITGSGRPT